MAKLKTTQLSTKYFEEKGWAVANVEKWNAFAKIRQDCFGFGDLLVFGSDSYGIMHTALVQTTSASNLAKRRKKVLSIKMAERWMRAGNLIILHGWKKAKKGFDPEVAQEVYGINVTGVKYGNKSDVDVTPTAWRKSVGILLHEM